MMSSPCQLIDTADDPKLSATMKAQRPSRPRCGTVGLVTTILASLAGCSHNDTTPPVDLLAPADLSTSPDLGGQMNLLPAFVSGPVLSHTYDGIADDLLTAGVGQKGLSGTAPMPADPAHPTAAELRRWTLLNQYKALKDTRPAAGYGTLYGPAVPSKFATPKNDGRVPGREYLTYADDGSGKQNVTLVVQVPQSFDKDHPCLVATVSSGSRGVYGAIGTAGEWGLKNGCAVAYADKGTGNGVHDLSSDTVNLIDGTRLARNAAQDAGLRPNFIAVGSDKLSLLDYIVKFPNRIAQKHAHSQQNPEATWGRDVLNAASFGFYILNLKENFGQPAGSGTLRTLTPERTVVIAASVSNGGGSVLRALEQDTAGLIDGVVAGEPNINPRRLAAGTGFTIQQGGLSFDGTVHGRPLFDYISYLNVFQPCASAATMIALGADPAKGPPAMGGGPAGIAGRCAALHRLGYLKATALLDQAAEAQGLINSYGTLSGANIIAHPYTLFYVYSSIAVTYANTYGRFSVTDNLCGYSFGATTGAAAPMPKTQAALAADFAAGNGVPPSNGTNLLKNAGNAGAGQEIRQGMNANGEVDEYLNGALCLRHLATGTTGVTADTGSPLTGDELAQYQRVQTGMKEVLGTGDLRGKPVLILHGRDDALLGPNFTSRSYYGLNQRVEGKKSQVSYVEVLHANHLDSFNKLFNIDTQIPLDYYFQSALDRMYDHLRNGAALPGSQVLPTKPIGTTGDPMLTTANLTDFDGAASCPIKWSQDLLDIPECSK